MAAVPCRLNADWMSCLQNSHGLSSQAVLRALTPVLKLERMERLAAVARARCLHVAVVLEGLYDLGNVGAVLRSCDAFGFHRVHLINRANDRYKVTRAVSAGAEKWLDLERWGSTTQCIQHLRNQGYKIAVADARPHASLPRLDLKNMDAQARTALLFGNEHAGISSDALALADARFEISMFGFVESLNVSVAAAVALSMVREKITAASVSLTNEELEHLQAEFAVRSFLKVHGGPSEWNASRHQLGLIADICSRTENTNVLNTG